MLSISNRTGDVGIRQRNLQTASDVTGDTVDAVAVAIDDTVDDAADAVPVTDDCLSRKEKKRPMLFRSSLKITAGRLCA
jgi:hypothetical protein